MQLIFLSEDHKNALNDFIVRFSPRAFLQTYEWGDFQKNIGRKIWRIGIFNENNILQFTASIFLYDLPMGSYLYCPFGPIFSLDLSDKFLKICFKLFLEEIKILAKKENAILLKIEPLFLKTNKQFLEILDEFNFRKSFKEIQPKTTLLLNLDKTEEKIFGKMKPKNRYNINLAKKRGVDIIEGGISDFDKFFILLVKTAKRNNFNLHPKDYYFQMFKNFLSTESGISKNNLFMKVFFAKFENKFIATALVAFFSKFSIYLHGGFDYNARNLAPSNLLQWEIIKKAKKMGYRFYDFWGIDVKWPGVTRFKRSFGGREYDYIGAYDLIFRPISYNIYKLISKFKNEFF